MMCAQRCVPSSGQIYTLLWVPRWEALFFFTGIILDTRRARLWVLMGLGDIMDQHIGGLEAAGNFTREFY